MRDDIIYSSLSNKRFSLIILPTEKCNLNCIYCYEKKYLGKMEEKVVQGIKNLINNRINELEVLEVSWFGGEPLLAKSVINQISSFIVDLKEKYNFKYISSMTTNGYFLDFYTASELVKNGVNRFQITFDGNKDIHDKIRVKNNGDGSGTFDKIWQNLINIKNSQLNLTILLRIHYSPDTYFKLDNFIDILNSNFGNDLRFIFLFRSIQNYNNLNMCTFSFSEDQNVRVLLEKKINNKKQLFDSIDDGASLMCYAAKPNCLIIRPNGEINKCTIAFDDDKNKVGLLTDSGKITFNKDNFSYWIRGIESLDNKTLACPLKN